MDWSDHAMWWPEKNIWLDKTRWTLDQYNITADATIYFTPMHKTLKIQLPDLRYVDCSVDFSIKTFNASIALSKELGNNFVIMEEIRIYSFNTFTPDFRAISILLHFIRH